MEVIVTHGSNDVAFDLKACSYVLLEQGFLGRIEAHELTCLDSEFIGLEHLKLPWAPSGHDPAAHLRQAHGEASASDFLAIHNSVLRSIVRSVDNSMCGITRSLLLRSGTLVWLTPGLRSHAGNSEGFLSLVQQRPVRPPEQKEDHMLPKLIVGAAAAAALMSGVAFAQSSTVNGAAGGAVTGAIVGGPVGAAVGGVAGAIVGTAIDPPPEKVVTYVREAPAPSTRVVVKEKVVVGQPLPQTVVVTPVPENSKYSYAIVNNERVIVEPSSRKVIQIIN